MSPRVTRKKRADTATTSRVTGDPRPGRREYRAFLIELKKTSVKNLAEERPQAEILRASIAANEANLASVELELSTGDYIAADFAKFQEQRLLEETEDYAVYRGVLAMSQLTGRDPGTYEEWLKKRPQQKKESALREQERKHRAEASRNAFLGQTCIECGKGWDGIVVIPMSRWPNPEVPYCREHITCTRSYRHEEPDPQWSLLLERLADGTLTISDYFRTNGWDCQVCHRVAWGGYAKTWCDQSVEHPDGYGWGHAYGWALSRCNACQTLIVSARPRKFCSQACAHPPVDTLKSYTCEVCGADFEANRNATTCSSPCRQKKYRERIGGAR